MNGFRRYGVYAVPEGDLYAAGAAWLGWNSVSGARLPHPTVADLPQAAEEMTATPRKYGFHGTIKPPFFLAGGTDFAALEAAMADFCATRPPVALPPLIVKRLGGFVAIVPERADPGLAALAAATVEALDPFRAPPSDGELARRRKAGLSDRQEALLLQWGYPYVMEEFRFHLTLTGRLARSEAEAAQTALAAHFAPVLDAPVTLDSLCLMGEDDRGRFHLIHRHTLSG